MLSKKSFEDGTIPGRASVALRGDTRQGFFQFPQVLDFLADVVQVLEHQCLHFSARVIFFLH